MEADIVTVIIVERDKFRLDIEFILNYEFRRLELNPKKEKMNSLPQLSKLNK